MRLVAIHVALIVLSVLLVSPIAPAQEQEQPTLRVSGLVPGGVRTSLTESWGAVDFRVTNPTDRDRQARVLAFFGERPDVQYGRDVWVPARATLLSWLLTGPAGAGDASLSRDFQFLLYDRTEGTDQLVLPKDELRLRSRGVLYRKREPISAILLDEEAAETNTFGQLPRPESRAEEAIHFARAFRAARKLSEFVQVVSPGFLPPTPVAFEGIDHFILASGRIAADPDGMRALRQWLEQGGRVWVMLDLVEPEVLLPLLGDALDFHVVDRVSLTDVTIEERPTGRQVAAAQQQGHERPVELVRIVLSPHEQVTHTVNGWPAWFTRTVGRGKVVITTLGARGWYRPRTANDPASPYTSFPALPVATTPLELMAAEVQSPRGKEPFKLEAFQQPLVEQIGYSVVGLPTVGLVFGAFLLSTVVLGIGFRRSSRPELLGWIGPAAALGTAAVFLTLGEMSRRAAAPTVAVAQLVDAVATEQEAAVHGVLAVYRPDSGPAEIGATQGGFFEMDLTGIEGQIRRLILTDRAAWHWQNLALPAGVRLAPFRYTAATAEPIKAAARFGPAGVEGKLTAVPFREVGDALLCTPGGRHLAVRLHPDGTFDAGSGDILPRDRFLASALLSDRQQQRRELYRQFLKEPGIGPLEDRNVLLAWADPIEMGFDLGLEGRTVGTALLIVPLELERAAPGARLTIPGPLIPYRRVMDAGLARPTLELRRGISMDLRFQLPPAVLPLEIEKAALSARIDAPSRRVTLARSADGELVELYRVDSPLDPIRIPITEKRMLRLDDEGGLTIRVSISDSQGDQDAERDLSRGNEKWTIEYIELETTGRVGERNQ